MVHHGNRTTFRSLETRYRFLAAKDHDVPGQTYAPLVPPGRKPHGWLASRFPATFLRRLAGLPTKKPAGRRRVQTIKKMYAS